MKMKKIIASLLAAVMLIGMLPVISAGAVATQNVKSGEIFTGNCGTYLGWDDEGQDICEDNATYEFDTATGVLTISGTGEVGLRFNSYLYCLNSDLNYQDLVTSVIINDGITSLEDGGVFKYLENLTTVSLPSTLTSIGRDAFEHCSTLSKIDIPTSVTEIGSDAFVNCTGLSGNLIIPESVTSIGYNAFRNTDISAVYFECSAPPIAYEAPPYTYEYIDEYVTANHSGKTYDELCTELLGMTCSEMVDSYGNSTSTVAELNLFSEYARLIAAVYDYCNYTGEDSRNAFTSYCNSTSTAATYCYNQLFRRNDIDDVYYETAYFDPVSEGEARDYSSNSHYYYYKEGTQPDVPYFFNFTVGSKSFDEDVVFYYKEGKEGWTEEIVTDETSATGYKWNGYQIQPSAYVEFDSVGGSAVATEFLTSITFNEARSISVRGAGDITVTHDTFNINEAVMPEKDGYVFMGWYYEDDSAVVHNTEFSQTTTTLYAKWKEIGVVEQDDDDTKIVAGDEYLGFDLFGVQIRKDDYHAEDATKIPGGLRFVTTLSEDIFRAVKALGNNIKYGYVVGSHNVVAAKNPDGIENGIVKGTPGTTDIDCTSKADHKNFNAYRIYSLVITYEGEDDAFRGTDIVARAYISYTDANGNTRVLYNDYGGASVFGGCCTSYTAAQEYYGTDGVFGS